jgi:uncharacterized protein (TIGR02145 family)
MKRTFFIVVLCAFYSISVLGQSKKNEELLTSGIKSNDFEKVTKALSEGATPNDGLIKAIELDNLEYTKIFLDKGADPSSALLSAVSQNNISIVEYLLDKGAKFLNEKSYIIEGPSYLIDKENLKNKIPITLSRINDKDCWLMKNEADIAYVKEKGEHSYIEYVLKDTLLANNALIYAINNNNLQMVNLLLKHGINSRSYCFAKYLNVQPWITDRATGSSYYSPYYFNGESNNIVVTIDGVRVEVLNRSSNGVFLSRFTPSLPVIMRPIEYAISKNVDKGILDALLLYDSIPNYKFHIKNVTCIEDNPKLSNITVDAFDYGFNINFKIKNENVFGYKIYYSLDKEHFKEINDITFPTDTINQKVTLNENLTHYFYNDFGDSIRPRDITLKISLKEYGILTDKKDGEKYKTVKIGNQEIMAENLRFKMDKGCWSGTNKKYDIKKHGYLYTWGKANEIAIDGWHLPNLEEWEKLFKEVGGNSQFKLHPVKGGLYRSEEDGITCAVNQLKEGASTGFNLPLTGSRTIYAVFEGFGKSDVYWTSTPTWDFYLQQNVQWLRGFNSYANNAPKNCGASVRLFKTDTTSDNRFAYETFVDEKDGHKYKTLKIGDQVVMAENYQYKSPDGCWAYEKDEKNVKEYGYLYNYETAIKLAPKGWHLPSKEEWEKLYKYLGNSEKDVFKALQPGGTSGFNSSFGGWRENKHKSYNFKLLSAFYWSSTSFEPDSYWSLGCYLFFIEGSTNIYGEATMRKNNPNDGLSIRYFKD